MFQAGAIATPFDVDLSRFTAGFDRAEREARAFGGRIGGVFSGVGRMISGPVVAAIGVVGAALTVRAAINQVSDAMERIDNQAKSADRLGMTTEAFAALSHQAKLSGVDIETLEMAVSKLQPDLAAAAAGAKGAGDGLAKLGLDAAVMADLPVEQTLGLIGDKLNAIENPAERAAAAVDVFGQRAGPKLLNLLMSGTAGIEQARAEAEKLGITFSRIDAAKVEAANDAMAKVDAAVQGVVQTLAIELAPYAQAAADWFTDAATAGGGFGETATNAVEAVASGIAYVSDWVELLEAGFKLLQAGATLAVQGLVTQIGGLARAIAWVQEKLGADQIDTTFFDEYAKGLGEDVQRLTDEAGEAFENFQNGTNADKVARFFDDTRARSQAAAEQIAADAEKNRGSAGKMGDAFAAQQKKIADAFEQLHKDIGQFGMSDLDVRLAEFKASGADEGQVAQFAKGIEELKKLELGKEMKDAAEAWVKGIETPLEKLERELADMGRWRAEGLISDADYEKGLEKMRQEAEASGKGDLADATPKLASFVQSGSQEAYRLRAEVANARESNKIPMDQLAEAKTQTQILERIERQRVAVASAF